MKRMKTMATTNSKGPSNADAFSALETAMEWYEQQSKRCHTQLLLLKRVRDLAAKKRRFLGMAETGGKSTDFRSPFGLEKFQSPTAVGSARQSHFKVRSAFLRKLRENSQVHLSSKELAARHHLIHGPVPVRGPRVADHCLKRLRRNIQTIEEGALDVLESAEWLYLHSNEMTELRYDTFKAVIDNLHVLDLHGELHVLRR
ncbi:uncharacterized protein TNCV_2552881 [Trichonephila clavipes]|nr:uncharacterized protein TNCV_2552881 [Trichonephila clavipes]